MKLTVNDTTPARVLLNNDELFIPAYQRPYRWEGDKSKQLLRDVADYLKSQDRDLFRAVNRDQTDRIEYFTGATVTTLDSKDALEIIDGQQRTTTFYLVAFIKYMVIARILRERLDAGDKRALEVIEKAIDARNLVFTKDCSFDRLRELKVQVDEDALSFDCFLNEAESLINALTRESVKECNWKLKIRYARSRISEDLTEALCRGCSLVVNETGFELSVTEETVFPSESYQTTLESCLECVKIGSQSSAIAIWKLNHCYLTCLMCHVFAT